MMRKLWLLILQMLLISSTTSDTIECTHSHISIYVYLCIFLVEWIKPLLSQNEKKKQTLDYVGKQGRDMSNCGNFDSPCMLYIYETKIVCIHIIL